MARLLGKTPIPPDGGAVSTFETGEREPNLFVTLEHAKLTKINPALIIDDGCTIL
jgi:hypothetical protein